MVLDGLLGQAEARADLGVAEPGGDQLQGLALARGELVERPPRARVRHLAQEAPGETGRHVGVARTDRTDNLHERRQERRRHRRRANDRCRLSESVPLRLTGDGRGANGTQGFIGNLLYISGHRATQFFDIIGIAVVEPGDLESPWRSGLRTVGGRFGRSPNPTRSDRSLKRDGHLVRR